MWRKYNCFYTDQTLKVFLVSFKPWLKIKREPWGKVEYWLLIINLRLHRIGTKYTKKRLNLKRESSTLNISGNSCNFFFLKILRGGGGGFLSRQKLKGEIIMFRVFFAPVHFFSILKMHAARSGHSNFSESTEEIKPLTEEEKKQQQEK